MLKARSYMEQRHWTATGNLPILHLCTSWGGIADLPTTGMVTTYSAAVLSAAEHNLHARSAVSSVLCVYQQSRSVQDAQLLQPCPLWRGSQPRSSHHVLHHMQACRRRKLIPPIQAASIPCLVCL